MSKRAVDTLCLLTSVAAIGLMTAPAAQAQSPKTFNIPPKSLAAALNDFASQSQELYEDLGSIGTAVMAVLESPRNGILFSTKHLRECVIAENEEDRVDQLTRRWQWTAKQAIQAWGDQCPDQIQKTYETKPEEKFWFLHHVGPRMQRDETQSNWRNKAFESIYVAEAAGKVLSEGGFDEFPYIVPRFAKGTGETYGRSPGMTALPDIKMLNSMAKTVLQNAQQQVDPPLQLPDDAFLMPISVQPGARNTYRMGSRDKVEPIQTGSNIPLGIEMLNTLRQQIMRVMMVDFMMMPSDMTDPLSAGKGITATYTLQQRDEKMRMLSPILARAQAEFLGPLIDRTFAIMWRRSAAVGFGTGSMLARPPASLSGVSLAVDYVSPIAVAQRSSQLDGVQRLVQSAMSIAQIDPTVIHTLDADAILRLTAKDLNTPSLALRTPDQVAAIQQQAAQAQQAQAQAAQMQSLASTAKDGAGAVAQLAQVAQQNPGAAPQPIAA